MSDRMPTAQALEQLREVISILRELSNAGPRDQSFKQWRQVTLTLLQRIWPNDQGNAARFRRIPFSPPSSRADARTVRECYERGVCEAIAYLESLLQEIESGTSRLGRKLVRLAEAPLASAAEPPRPAEPEQIREPRAEAPSAQPLIPADPMPAPPPKARESSIAPRPAKPAPAPAAPERPAVPPAPPAPARAASPPPASEKPAQARPERRSKPRLKDMLGFGDDVPAPPPVAEPSAPPPRAESPAPPVRSAAPAPFTEPPAMPPAASPVPEPEIGFEPTIESSDEPPFDVTEEPPFDVADEPPFEATDEPAPESAGEDAPWSAPVIPFPGHKVVVGRPSGSRPPAPAEDDAEEQAFDAEYDLTAEAGFDIEPPPATLREMLDRGPTPRRSAPSRAAREVLAMASAVDQLGVPPQRRAIVRAALIDLGHQMEVPPVHWAAIRQAMAFMMDYPQVARRVIPMLLPYLDEAA